MFLKKTFFVGVVAMSLFGGMMLGAQAETLSEALKRTHTTNPTLTAAQAAYDRAEYLIPQAEAGYLPTVEAGASQTWSRRDSELKINAPGFVDKERLSTQDMNLQITQPLYKGGRTVASIENAQQLLLAEKATLTKAEQTVLLESAQAYLGLEKAKAVLSLREKNVEVLEEQLKATKERFDVGELTLTDISQAESRLSGAEAELVAAQGELAGQIAVYEEKIGSVPAGIVSENDVSFTLPQSVGEAIQIALQSNPEIILVGHQRYAAESQVDSVSGELLPEVNLIGEIGKSYNPSTTTDNAKRGSLGVQLSVPLYQGGEVRARLNQAKQTVHQRMAQIKEVERLVRRSVIAAWNDYVSSKARIVSIEARIVSIEAQIEAANVALIGVQEESQVGDRTILDILDAEQELLDARVSLVSAKHDYAISQFQLMQVLGGLNLENIVLKQEQREQFDHNVSSDKLDE